MQIFCEKIIFNHAISGNNYIIQRDLIIFEMSFKINQSELIYLKYLILMFIFNKLSCDDKYAYC